MSLWQRVVQANRPGPPEHSVAFRVASALTVCIAAAACWSQGELSAAVAAFTVVATVVGNVLSYRTRRRPWPAVKPVLAVCAVGGFAWFLLTVTHTATPGDIATVEGPLAVLFAWVLCTHAFDVPSRRDVAYSLAGSAALMAVAAAQSVDLSLAVYVAAWLVTGLWGLVAMWQSMSGARGAPWGTLAAASVAVAVVSVVLVAVLPAPHVSASLVFPSSSAGDSPVSTQSGLTDGSPSLPAHAASPQGRTGVGGILGFAKALDTGLRASLGNEVVLRVRADRPSFWIAQTYDRWDGQSWTQSTEASRQVPERKLVGGSPFAVPPSLDQVAPLAAGAPDIQTFYLAQSGPNLILHADDAQRVYVQSRDLYLTGNGTIVSSTSMGAGTVYTVVSSVNTATPAQLRQATVPPGPGRVPAAVLPTDVAQLDLQLPHAYPRVAGLAASITRSVPATPADPRTYDRVEAIEAWMAGHVRYTTDIPPLARGADAVDSFLFGSRLGYCEQISTATVVMLRTLGIPAREAVGYVPGPYDPITDLYDVQAKDAHAWVQVWFPGYGWQDFDPTADVPLANPTPGAVLGRDLGHLLDRTPWVVVVVVVGLVAAVATVGRRRRRRPASWALQLTADLTGAGARRGVRRRPSETLTAFGLHLAAADPARAGLVAETVGLVERHAYAGVDPPPDEVDRVVRAVRAYRRERPGRDVRRAALEGEAAGTLRRPVAVGVGVGRGVEDPVTWGAQPRDRASASSNEAPAASSGR